MRPLWRFTFCHAAPELTDNINRSSFLCTRRTPLLSLMFLAGLAGCGPTTILKAATPNALSSPVIPSIRFLTWPPKFLTSRAKRDSPRIQSD